MMVIYIPLGLSVAWPHIGSTCSSIVIQITENKSSIISPDFIFPPICIITLHDEMQISNGDVAFSTCDYTSPILHVYTGGVEWGCPFPNTLETRTHTRIADARERKNLVLILKPMSIINIYFLHYSDKLRI